MTTEPSTEFIACFEAEVREQYLAMGSKIRNTVRTQNNVQPDHMVEFQQENSDTRTPCFLQDYYAGDWIDDLEAVTHNVSEQQALAKSSAYALGHKSDELIVEAVR